MYIEDNPNFTIVMPKCNAKCKFCTYNSKNDNTTRFLKNIENVVKNLPYIFKQVSISGGEPTLNPDRLFYVLNLFKHKKNIKKIVLTTNGTNLEECIPYMVGLVNHVNLSRHASTEKENSKIFGIPIDDKYVKNSIYLLNKNGIDVNLNRVYSKKDELKQKNVFEYVEYAKSLGASSVCFRYDCYNNSLEKTYLEKIFKKYTIINEGSCASCRSHTILLDGMRVTFKASLAEPSSKEKNITELIYQSNGKLTTDWKGAHLFDLEALCEKLDELEEDYEDENDEEDDDEELDEDYEEVTVPNRSCGGGTTCGSTTITVKKSKRKSTTSTPSSGGCRGPGFFGCSHG